MVRNDQEAVEVEALYMPRYAAHKAIGVAAARNV